MVTHSAGGGGGGGSDWKFAHSVRVSLLFSKSVYRIDYEGLHVYTWWIFYEKKRFYFVVLTKFSK